MGPEDGGGELMKARKKFGALRVEMEKGKHDDHAAEMVFQNTYLNAFNKCWPLQKNLPGGGVISLVDFSLAENIVGNYVLGMGCILLKVIIEEKPPSFFFSYFDSTFIKAGDSETRKGLGLKSNRREPRWGCSNSLEVL